MYNTYVVRDGDTIDSIAIKFNTKPNIIRMLNGNDLNIIPGNTILVPSMSQEFFDYYMVSNGDTLYSISSKNNINPSLLAELNGVNIDDYIYPNQVLLIPKSGSKLYITGIGDTLNGVVSGFNVTIDELVKQNNNIYLQPEQLIVYKDK